MVSKKIFIQAKTVQGFVTTMILVTIVTIVDTLNKKKNWKHLILCYIVLSKHKILLEVKLVNVDLYGTNNVN